MPPGPPGSTEGKPKAKIEDQLTDEEKTKTAERQINKQSPSGPGLVKQGDGSVIDDVVISRARQLP